MPLGPSDSASAVGQQANFGAYAAYAQAYGQMGMQNMGMQMPMDQFGMTMQGPMYPQQMPANGTRSTIMPPPNFGMPMMQPGGPQSVMGYPGPYFGPQFGPTMFGAIDPHDFDDSASVRARNSLAMAWLEREREKERQRQHERHMEQASQFTPAAMQAFPPVANMPPVLPGSLVFIPGYGYVQQPQPMMQQQPMWASLSNVGYQQPPQIYQAPPYQQQQMMPMQMQMPPQSARPSRPSSIVSARSFTGTLPKPRTTKPRPTIATSRIAESDSDEDVPLNALGMGKSTLGRKDADTFSMMSWRTNGVAQNSKAPSIIAYQPSGAPVGLNVPVQATPVGQAAQIPKDQGPRPRTK
jgi:hypothetical protein